MKNRISKLVSHKNSNHPLFENLVYTSISKYFCLKCMYVILIMYVCKYMHKYNPQRILCSLKYISSARYYPLKRGLIRSNPVKGTASYDPHFLEYTGISTDERKQSRLFHFVCPFLECSWIDLVHPSPLSLKPRVHYANWLAKLSSFKHRTSILHSRFCVRFLYQSC